MKNDTVMRIWRYIRPYRMQLLAGMAGAFFYVAFTLAQPVLIGKAIDKMLGAGRVDFSAVLLILLALIVCVLLASAFHWALGVATRKVSAFAARDMRIDATSSIATAPLRVLDTHSHGDMISCVLNDAELVSEGVMQLLTQLLPGVVTIAGTLLVMFLHNAWIALAVVVITPLSIVFAGFIAKRTAGLFKKQAAANGALSGFVGEMIRGKSTVEAFSYEETAFCRFEAINETLFQSGVKSIFYSSISNPGTRFINSTVYAVVGVLGAIFAIAGSITVGQLSVFLTYANQYTKPFNEISGVLTQISAALASARRLLTLIDITPEVPDAPTAQTPKQCEGAVTLSAVSFAYEKHRPLITDFSLAVRPGQRIAIVGPTGCGKTTLINLLMRFYDVDQGTITVDGSDIRLLRRKDLRGFYGMVLQDTWLKNATVADNIAYGRPDATREEIVAAAKESYAHGFIKRLEHGYDTVLQAGGANLSAGQKQLLCIARIMLCRPEMLILDEATSSIDTRTEMLVQQAFEKLMQGRTSFVVAHRLSTVQTADVILVMNAGRIIERGTHQALLEQKGFYEQLYQSQYAHEKPKP